MVEGKIIPLVPNMLRDVEVHYVGRRTVGYVLRGRPQRHKKTTISPLDDAIHADCVLPEGHIAGYAYTDEEAGSLRASKEIGLTGGIAVDDAMVEHYRDITSAKDKWVLSALLLFEVESHQAAAFQYYWNKFQSNPIADAEQVPNYNRYFNNCATFCYRAFKEAHILEGGVLFEMLHPIITPVMLYNMLLKKYPGSDKGVGYFGIAFDERSNYKGYKILFNKIDPKGL